MRQLVNTDIVNSTVGKLRIANTNINDEFRVLQSKMLQLETVWKGASGTVAQTTMYQFFSYNETRSSVIQDHVKILEQLVSSGYINIENNNIKLADMFKE